MKRITLLLMLFLIVACSNANSANVTSTSAATATFTATPKPSETPIPTPTESPKLTSESQSWIASHLNFHLQDYINPNGLNVDFGDGKVINVPSDQLESRIRVGQEGALQIYNETGDQIVAAFDPETNKWIDRDNVVAKDVFNMESYIHVKTWEQAQELFRLEKHFMIPFPKGTGFPILSEQRADYQRSGELRGTLGNPQPGSEPTLLFNGVILDQGEGREEGDYASITEQINNIDDTFSAVHFGRTTSKLRDITLKTISTNRYRKYILPVYEETKLSDLQNIKSSYPFIYKLWKDTGLYDGEGLIYKGIKSLVVQWLTTGKFPKELENIILFDYVKDYDYSDHN